jgi:NAD(P)-dependent dehydrogenase (short-subunit alcohol dehydrogenase family)
VYRAVPLEQADETVWNAALDIDLRATYLCARAAVPHMRAAGGGRIVNFSDWVAASGRPRYTGYVHYYVAKRAVIGLTEALALELAESGILVNAIAPGPILATPGTTTDEYDRVVAATPLGRWGGEAEIVEAVRFLLTTGFVTGETIRVDGGRHVR